MLLRRLFLLGVVVALLLVPALARAGQTLDLGHRPTAASSFTKSFDVPPDLVVVPPDRTYTPVDVETLQHPAADGVSLQPATLADDPDLARADTLRGPPSLQS